MGQPGFAADRRCERDLGQVELGVDVFASARVDVLARQALAGLTRVYLSLEKSIDFLPECPPAENAGSSDP